MSQLNCTQVVGLVFMFVEPDVEVIGLSIPNLVNLLTVLIGFLVITAWAISGFMFISRMQKVCLSPVHIDTAPARSVEFFLLSRYFFLALL